MTDALSFRLPLPVIHMPRRASWYRTPDTVRSLDSTLCGKNLNAGKTARSPQQVTCTRCLSMIPAWAQNILGTGQP